MSSFVEKYGGIYEHSPWVAELAEPVVGDSTDMEEIAQSGGKAILFSQWTRCLDWLDERLQPYGPLVYHGGVPTKKREPILRSPRHWSSRAIVVCAEDTMVRYFDRHCPGSKN